MTVSQIFLGDDEDELRAKAWAWVNIAELYPEKDSTCEPDLDVLMFDDIDEANGFLKDELLKHF